jgi:conjugative transfer signal peptidase TraF
VADAPKDEAVMRAGGLLICVFGTLGVGFACLAPMPVKLIWNASASVPVGLYTVVANTPLDVADVVAFVPSEPLASFLAERGYLPDGLSLLKRVLAMPGQLVCRTNLAITVDGAEVGSALARDRAGRDLPAWQGCRRIHSGEVFLMNRQVRDSFDGRYFGPTTTDLLLGAAVPLWTDDGSGRFRWRQTP